MKQMSNNIYVKVFIDTSKFFVKEKLIILQFKN